MLVRYTLGLLKGTIVLQVAVLVFKDHVVTVVQGVPGLARDYSISTSIYMFFSVAKRINVQTAIEVFGPTCV